MNTRSAQSRRRQSTLACLVTLAFGVSAPTAVHACPDALACCLADCVTILNVPWILGCSAGPILSVEPHNVYDDAPRFGLENAFLGRSEPGSEWVEIPDRDQRRREVPLQVGLYNPEADLYTRRRGEVVSVDFFIAPYVAYLEGRARWIEVGEGMYNEDNGMWELDWDTSSLPGDGQAFMVRADLTDVDLRTRIAYNLAIRSPRTVLVDRGGKTSERAAFQAYEDLRARAREKEADLVARDPDALEIETPELQPSRTERDTAPLRFRRGDCDGDGLTAGVADAVLLLNFNFLGREAPSCRAACDVNADGEIAGLVDAIFLLKHNFLGGVTPASPYPGCGQSALGSDTVLGCAEPPAQCN